MDAPPALPAAFRIRKAVAGEEMNTQNGFGQFARPHSILSIQSKKQRMSLNFQPLAARHGLTRSAATIFEVCIFGNRVDRNFIGIPLFPQKNTERGDFMVSHPFHKEREMDGARKSIARSKSPRAKPE
jgi:hypothetical protein